MLLIAMNDTDLFLNRIESVLKDNGIKGLRVTRDNTGLSEMPDSKTPENKGVFSKRNFRQAVVASLNTKELVSVREGLKTIEDADEYEEKGFVCILPYEKLVDMVYKERRNGFMEITQHLNAKFICTELNSTTKEEAIRELAGLIKGASEINDFERFIHDVFERESAMTTGIGNEIAIPHARTEAVDSLIIALGRSHKGIKFDSVDKQKAKLVFLIGTPKKDMGIYLRVLAYLTRMLKKDEIRKRLLDAKGPEEIIGIFKKTNS